jgi:ubiquinone biosynthesis monooxygenase Coq7
MQRQLSSLDQILASAQTALATVFTESTASSRPDPAAGLSSPELSASDKAAAARLMRVNHVGEVCAQALYEGQALAASSPQVRQSMLRAAAEERDHLKWCETRLNDLDGRPSLLNPLWYSGSFVMGLSAGMLGDRWSLGFLKETEEQVEAHLESHLDRLPSADIKSRAIVEQMKKDERAHAEAAHKAGAHPLPGPLKWLMRIASRAMTSTAHWI